MWGRFATCHTSICRQVTNLPHETYYPKADTFEPFPVLFLVTALALLASSAVGSAQTRPMPFYALPSQGDWVEYEWQSRVQGKPREAGALRISLVGKKDAGGVPAVWVEIKKETHNGAGKQQEIRKLLVAGRTFNRQHSLENGILEAYDKKGSGPVTRLSGTRLRAFLDMGIEGQALALKTIEEKEPLEIALGKYLCRHVTAEGRAGDRTLKYDAWLTDLIPFGCAKFQIREKTRSGTSRVIFSALAARSGKNAKSELTETGAK